MQSGVGVGNPLIKELYVTVTNPIAAVGDGMVKMLATMLTPVNNG